MGRGNQGNMPSPICPCCPAMKTIFNGVHLTVVGLLVVTRNEQIRLHMAGTSGTSWDSASALDLWVCNVLGRGWDHWDTAPAKCCPTAAPDFLFI